MDEKKARYFREMLEKETYPHAREQIGWCETEDRLTLLHQDWRQKHTPKERSELPSWDEMDRRIRKVHVAYTARVAEPENNLPLELNPYRSEFRDAWRARTGQPLRSPQVRWDLPWGVYENPPLTAEDYEAIVEAEPDEPTPALSDLMDEAEEKYYEPSRPGDEEWYLNCLCAQIKLNDEDAINAVRYLRNRVHRMEQWHYEVHERTLEMQEYVDHLAEKLYELLNKED